MVGQTRNKYKEAAPEPLPSSRSMQPKRRRRTAGAGEPEMEEEPPLQPSSVGGGELPGGAREYLSRKYRYLYPKNALSLAVVARYLLLDRFRFLHCVLQQLREKMVTFQTQEFSERISLGIAVCVGILHWIHLVTLFENDRHFSHLSSLEREMTFRTEMGLYYSYFKTIVEAPSFLEGLWMIMNDRLTEYPLVINTVKRFHLYPEVIIAFWYRVYTGIMNLFGIETKICWNVTRIELPNEIESCEGLGDPACFYVAVIFILNGLMLGLFFLFGAYLSGTQLGGLITVLCYFFNHGEATRVMWTPPLRESFSYPFLVLQIFMLTYILRTSTSCRRDFIGLCVSNVAFMLPWQFAQFILFTQVASLFPMYVVGYIEPCKFQRIIYSHMISVLLCFILMFGNPMYLSSYYSSSLLVTWAIILKRNKIHRLGMSELNFWLIQGGSWLFGTIILKHLTSKILGVSDHIRLSDLITARILGYTDFDTLIYTCAPEFDFMEKETPLRYTKTLLLPIVTTIAGFIIKKIFRDVLCVLCTNTYQRKQILENGELVFHMLQFLAFSALAILIMRLKLFLTPHMCIMASLICSRRLFGWLFCRVRFENFIFGILTVMSIQGCANLHNQWSIKGEFYNVPQEELIQWIKYNTRTDAVFAGIMPTMASVKLSTLRPIVNHPHYEDADLRPGCSMLEIWDVEDPSNAANPPLCSILLKDARPYFTTVFQNSMFRVLKVN
ncbi:probable C-mannosyltransferase DPY19L2 isoform X2 [Choloepus didactylus]|uniref:probable C-mannosyltransferase DPY19L2 isoform X2 n=1 Tax=Choloepus didactylus TaxID=27675 RepID=UPI00189EFA07|nr:probable C-mannosyltransferase DPY19L2 isoform X2 [Choloepus didactylus]